MNCTWLYIILLSHFYIVYDERERGVVDGGAVTGCPGYGCPGYGCPGYGCPGYGIG